MNETKMSNMIKDDSFKAAEEFEKSMGFPMGDRIIVECKFTLDEMSVIKKSMEYSFNDPSFFKNIIHKTEFDAVMSLKDYFEI